MKTLRFLSALLLMTGVVISSCSKNDLEPEQEPQNPKNPVSTVKTYKVTVKTNGGVETKAALAESGSTLSFTWKVGDKLTVTKGGVSVGTLEAKEEGKTTTFEGTLTGDIAAGNTLVLSYLGPNYNAQDGTLNGIANGCDYAVSTVTVNSISGDVINTTTATFDLQQAVVKFTLKDADNAPLNASSLTIRINGQGDIAVTPPSATNILYVALAGISNKNISMTAVVNGIIYTYKRTASDVTFENKKYYTRTVKMSTSADIETPLTLEAMSVNTTVTFDNQAAGSVYYSVNGAAQEEIPANNKKPIVLANVGDKVSFYGTNSKYGTSASNTSSIIGCEGGTCYVYGNIMSLVSSSYSTATSLSDAYTFTYLFFGNENIFNHSEKDLVLPATTLANYCYSNMFKGCSNLSRASILPATTLKTSCYYSMYENCNGLISAPALPATTLETYCYYGMFWGCKNLTMAPVLPATTLKTSCYQYMFRGCTSLNYIKCLATDISATSCTSGWVGLGVPAGGTFIKAASMTGWTSGANGIPDGWTVEDAS